MKNNYPLLYVTFFFSILLSSPYETYAISNTIIKNERAITLYKLGKLALIDFENCIKRNAIISLFSSLESLDSPSSMCHISSNSHGEMKVSQGVLGNCYPFLVSKMAKKRCITTKEGKKIRIHFTTPLKNQLKTLVRIAWGNFLSAKITGTLNDISARLYDINEINRLLKVMSTYYDKIDLHSIKDKDKNDNNNTDKKRMTLFFQELFEQQQLSAVLLANTHYCEKDSEKIKLDSLSIFSKIKPSTDTANSARLIKMNEEMVSVIKRSDDLFHTIELTEKDQSIEHCAAAQDSIINEQIISQMNFHWNNFFNLTTTYHSKRSNRFITAFDKSIGDLAEIFARDGENHFINNLDREATQRYVISAFLFKHQDAHSHNILIDVDPVSGKYIPKSIDHGRELSPNPGVKGMGQFRASLFSDFPTSDDGLEDAPLQFIKKLDPMSEYQFFIETVMSEYDKKDNCYDAIHRMVKSKAKHFVANIITLKKLVEHNEKYPLQNISLNNLISYSRMVPETNALKESFLVYMKGQLSSRAREARPLCHYDSFYLDADKNDQWNSVYNSALTLSHNNEDEFFNVFSNLITDVFDSSFGNMPPNYYSPFRDAQKIISDPIVIKKISKMIASYTERMNPYDPYLEQNEYIAYKEEYTLKNEQKVMEALPVYLQNLVKQCEINNFL